MKIDKTKDFQVSDTDSRVVFVNIEALDPIELEQVHQDFEFYMRHMLSTDIGGRPLTEDELNGMLERIPDGTGYVRPPVSCAWTGWRNSWTRYVFSPRHQDMAEKIAREQGDGQTN